jgi:heme oxygenase
MHTPAPEAETAALPFSARIREASWAKHQNLDPTAADEPRAPGVFDRLFDGSLSLDDYTHWHAQQFFVYDALETAGERWRGHRVAGAFVFDELLRRDLIAADLAFLIGPDWRSGVEPLPATARYVTRIVAACGDWPGGYIAHSYTRYLGDLSGGQAFGKAARRNFGFDGAGAGFYDFAELGDLKAFKEDYRARLDAADLDEDDRARIIDEVLRAYDHNGELLAELASGLKESK